MTDNEIIKALECCSTDDGCETCPAHGTGCELEKPALDLINRQKAEIERLAKENIGLKYDLQVASGESLTAQSAAIKEFWNRVKAEKFTHKNLGELVYVEDGDNLVKEMEGDNNV